MVEGVLVKSLVDGVGGTVVGACPLCDVDGVGVDARLEGTLLLEAVLLEERSLVFSLVLGLSFVLEESFPGFCS